MEQAGQIGQPPQVQFCLLCGWPSAADLQPESGLLAMCRPQPGDLDIMRFKRGKITDPPGKIGTGRQVYPFPNAVAAGSKRAIHMGLLNIIWKLRLWMGLPGRFRALRGPPGTQLGPDGTGSPPCI